MRHRQNPRAAGGPCAENFLELRRAEADFATDYTRKMLIPEQCWHQSNAGTRAILAPEECWSDQLCSQYRLGIMRQTFRSRLFWSLLAEKGLKRGLEHEILQRLSFSSACHSPATTSY